MTKKDELGVLVCSDSGSVVYASGFLQARNLQVLLMDKLDYVRQEQKGMFPLKADPDLLVLFQSSNSNFIFFAQPCDKRSALFEFFANVPFAHAVFNHFIESPYASAVIIDEVGRIRFMLPSIEKFLGFASGHTLGKQLTDVIDNSRLHKVVYTGKKAINEIQSVRGVTRAVARIPITMNGISVGAIGHLVGSEIKSEKAAANRDSQNFFSAPALRKDQSDQKRNTYQLDHMVGESEAVQQLKSDIAKIAPMQVPVLIVGESGTGKELAAHSIHGLSLRRDAPMMFVNAAALPDGLVESELFGYEPGSFTGADRTGRKGKFELAHRGSLFFDEVGDMPADIQVKLLRVLQDGFFEKVGGNKPYHSDFRLICATNRDFQQLIRDREFRLDLYYRISGVTLRMPSLRERLDDIPVLVGTFLRAFAAKQGSSVKGANNQVYDYLREQPWPGNIRQLQHEVERAAIFCDEPELSIKDFKPALNTLAEKRPMSPPTPQNKTIKDATRDLEREMIREAMIRNNGNKKRVSEELGISRTYLYRKLTDG